MLPGTAHPPQPVRLSPSLGGALCCAGGGTGSSRGAAKFQCWAALGPSCAIHRWPQGGGRVTGWEGCLRPLRGNGPSLFSLQLLSAGAGPNGDQLSLLQCAEPWGTCRPLGGKELKSLCMLLAISPVGYSISHGPGTCAGEGPSRSLLCFAGMSVAIGAAFPLGCNPRVWMWMRQVLVLVMQRDMC